MILRSLGGKCARALWALALGTLAPGTVPVFARQQTPPPAPQAAPQDPNAPPDRWQDTAELSYVVTAGNSETSTLGFKNKLWRKWAASAFELNASGVRSEAVTKFAVGTPTDFDIEEESELTAEAYQLNGRYDRNVSPQFIWYGAGGWEKNTFAGIDNRYTAAAGVGNLWRDDDHLKFRTDYGVTYTRQDDVVEDPDFDDTFIGARVSYTYIHKLGAVTTYTSELIIDENLEETSDLRANMLNSVVVAMNKRLALSVSLRWLYDHQPALGSFDLFDPATGQQTGTVTDELEKLDTIFTTSLVINF